MATDPLPSVNADKIRWPTFSVVRRGFDQQEVLDYSAQVGDMVQALDDEIRRLGLEADDAADRHSWRGDIPAGTPPDLTAPGGVDGGWLPPAAPAADGEAIRRPKFSVVRGGFDRREVQVYTDEVADLVKSLSAEVQQLRLQRGPADRTEADRTEPIAIPVDAGPDDGDSGWSADADEPAEARALAQEQPDDGAPDREMPDVGADLLADDEDPYRGLSTHVAEVLKAMDRDVEERLREAETEAERRLREAETEAERRVAESEAQAARVLAEAEAQAARVLAEAETHAEGLRRQAGIEAENNVRQMAAAAHDVVDGARSEADRLLNDARAAAEEAKITAVKTMEQADAMGAVVARRRDSVLEALTAIRERVETMIDELGHDTAIEQEGLIRLNDDDSGNGSGREEAERDMSLERLPQMPGPA
jgi:cell division septum initiation protein DivIVA